MGLQTGSPQSKPEIKQWHLSCFVLGERCLHLLLAIAASIPILIVLATLGVFLYETRLFFQDVSIGDFLTDTQWAPLFEGRECGIFVIASATLMIASIAVLVAIPFGLLAAIYLSEYADPTIRRFLKPTLEALAGVPTVVYGYFALLTITPFLKSFLPGISSFNALSAGLITGVLITPMISSISEDAIKNIPDQLRQGGYALGFTQQEVILKIVLPLAFPGIIAAITLATSRALGETMIAAIAAGQSPKLTLNPLVPVESMTAFIVQVSLGDVSANSFGFHAIFTVGLVLFLMTLLLNWLGHWLVRRHRQTMTGLVIPIAETSNETRISLPPQTLDLSTDNETPLSLPANEFTASVIPRTHADRNLRLVTLLAALLGLIIFATLLFTLLEGGIPQLDWQFLTNFPSRKPETTGIYAALIGTIWLLILTALIAFPIGIGAALYLEEYLPQNSWSHILEIHLDNLAAVPSILYGLLGLALFVRAWEPLTGGRSILSAALVLSVIVLPLLIITTRNALRAIPDSQRQGGYAVGMSRWQVIYYLILPTAFPNILTGMLLALSRAIGETSPLIAIGAVAFISFTPQLSLEGLHSNFTTLPTQIFYWSSRPQPEFQNMAAATILVLGAFVLAMNVIAVLLRDVDRRYQ
jgi:phosphate transport system permease protein